MGSECSGFSVCLQGCSDVEEECNPRNQQTEKKAVCKAAGSQKQLSFQGFKELP